MAEYGLTESGVNIKRLDEILDSMHKELSEKWGVNTQQNPNSFLNVLLTNIADRLAELWELGQDVYYSQYPASAEGMYLDNVAQFTGIARAEDTPSYYHILCTGTDGTVIPSDTIIASVTSPVTNLSPTIENTISRSVFNNAAVKIVSVDGNQMNIDLNGNSYSITPTSGTAVRTVLTALAAAVTDADFDVSVDPDEDFLIISAKNETSTNSLVLSENLTTQYVGCVFTFETEQDGDIYLPKGAITEITKAVTGLTSVVNVGEYIAGRLAETDSEFRASYIEKIFSRSERMSESIKSAILDSCQGVTALAVYENDTNSTDSDGRYPHSIEVVVDGGDETEIAQQILNTKSGGINTYGSTAITLTGENDEEIVVRFNRPEYVYIYFLVEISKPDGVNLPTDYIDIIKKIIVSKMESLECGDDVIPQNMFLKEIYDSIFGIDYVSITMSSTTDTPDELNDEVIEGADESEEEEESDSITYNKRNIYANLRQRCITAEALITIEVDDDD